MRLSQPQIQGLPHSQIGNAEDISFDLNDPLGLDSNDLLLGIHNSEEGDDSMNIVEPSDIYSDIFPIAEEECFISDIFNDAQFGTELHSSIARSINSICLKPSDITNIGDTYKI